METGRYRVAGELVQHQWLLSGPEEVKFQRDGNTMTLPSGTVLSRTGGADQARQTYEQLYQSIRQVAEDAHKEVPVGAAVPGAISVSEVIPDVHPGQVFANASVYTTGIRFQWLLTPIHLYEVRNPNEPGFTSCSYTLLPNGRFCFDGWLYGVLIDDKLPFDERSPVEVLQREVEVRHQQFWGKYRVVPGCGALDSDQVEFVSDSGAQETMQAVDGRLYLATGSPRLLFNDYERVKKYGQQNLQR